MRLIIFILCSVVAIVIFDNYQAPTDSRIKSDIFANDESFDPSLGMELVDFAVDGKYKLKHSNQEVLVLCHMDVQLTKDLNEIEKEILNEIEKEILEEGNNLGGPMVGFVAEMATISLRFVLKENTAGAINRIGFQAIYKRKENFPRFRWDLVEVKHITWIVWDSYVASFQEMAGGSEGLADSSPSNAIEHQ